MDNLLKLTLTKPFTFDVKRLLSSLNQTEAEFKLNSTDGVETILYKDTMHILKKKPANSSLNYSYLPFISFEMANNNQIKSIQMGSHMRFKLLTQYTKDFKNPECELVAKYARLAEKRVHDTVDALSEEKKIQYAVPENGNKLIASVYQQHYVFADGPHQNVNYLGTTGIATCIGVAMVVKEQDKYARVALMHLDSINDIEGSIDKAIEELKANSKDISAYVLSDKQDRVDENILLTLNTFKEKGIETQLDISNDDRLVISLETGLPVKSLRTNQEIWLNPNKQLQEQKNNSLFSFNMSSIKQDAKKEYDFKNIPKEYIKQYASYQS